MVFLEQNLTTLKREALRGHVNFPITLLLKQIDRSRDLSFFLLNH